MRVVERDDIYKNMLPGRIIQSAVGHNSALNSEKMTICVAHYSPQSGPMEPHNHAEETVVVLDCKDGWVKRGPSKDNLNEKHVLKKGTVMYFDELEWHVFHYGKDGFIDALCIYGQVDNIRPEEIKAHK